jgi:pilus assembly protein CpaB
MQSRVLAIIIAVVLALVATTALVFYVNGADRRAISDQSPVRVWAAVEDIQAGTSVLTAKNAGQIDLVNVPRKSAVDGVVRSLTQIQDRVAAVDIVAGELLLQKRWVGSGDVSGRRLLDIPEGHQAIAVELDLTKQVAGFVTPGDTVSLLVSAKVQYAQAKKPVEQTHYLLQNIRVLAVGATALANANTQGGGGRVNQGKGTQTLTAVTLAVRAGDDVKRVAFAAEFGSIYLSLVPPNAEKINPGDPVVADNLTTGNG